LIVGGSDLVQIISVVQSRVIAQLSGHTGDVIDLVIHPTRVSLLLSVGVDKTMRLWDLKDPYNPCCVCIFETKAFVACFSADGSKLISGGFSGTLKEWELPLEILNSSVTSTCEISRKKKAKSTHPDPIKISSSKTLTKKHGNDIDCMAYIPSKNVFVTKSNDGKIVIWKDDDDQTIVSRISVPNGGHRRSRFSISRDGNFLCVGNSTGHGLLYLVDTGRLVHRFTSEKCKTPISSCTFSWDCRHVVMTSLNFVYRWSFREKNPKVQDEIEQSKDKDSDKEEQTEESNKEEM